MSLPDPLAPGLSAAEGDSNGTIASADAEQKEDFFSMFYLPSSHSYDEDVHLATSSSSASFQGAAAALVGGILSVLDTALAVLNEEFDNPSDSVIFESTEDDGEEFQRSDDSCVIENNVLGCCKKSSHSKLPTSASKTEKSSTKNEDKASDNLEQSTEHSECIAFLLQGCDECKCINWKRGLIHFCCILLWLVHQEKDSCKSIEQRNSAENYYVTPQHSLLIGSISTLQLYEEGSGDIMKALISDRHPKSTNSMDVEVHAGTAPELKIMKKEDSGYCIIRNECETNDGWLVVDD